MNPADERADLAEQYLDGDLDAAAWAAARATHGEALDQAVAAARARRAALAALPRPALPAALRDQLTALRPPSPPASVGGPNPRPTSSAPSPRRTRWWRAAVPTMLALLVLIILLRPESRPMLESSAPQQPVVKQTADRIGETHGGFQTAATGAAPAAASAPAPAVAPMAAPVVASAPAEAKDEAFAFAASPLADAAKPAAELDGALLGSAPTVAVEEGAAAKTSAMPEAEATAMVGSLAANAQPLTTTAGLAAPEPLLIAANWAPVAQRTERKEATTRQLDDAGAGQDSDQTMSKRARTAPAAPPGNTPAPPRALRITLSNGTTTELRLPAGSVRLVGLSETGRTLWSSPIHRQSEVVVAPGASAVWDEPVAVIPPGVVRLRIEAQGARSPELAP